MIKSVKVNSNQVLNALLAYKEMVGAASEKALMEMAEKTKDYAADLFAEAEYDGENDVSVDVWKRDNSVYVMAHGEALPYIEYGTGVQGPDGAGFSAASQVQDDNSFWYFNAEGRDIQTKAGGKKATYKTIGRNRYYYIAGRGKAAHKRYTDPMQLRDVNWDGGEPVSMSYEAVTRRAYNRKSPVEGAPDEVVRNSTKETKTREIFKEEARGAEKPTKDSYVTWGNPPNNVMLQAKEYLGEIYLGIIERHVKRLRK